MSSNGRIKFYKRLDVRLTARYAAAFLSMVLLIFAFLDYRLYHKMVKEVDRMLADEASEIVTEVLHNPTEPYEHLKELEQSILERKNYRMAFRVLEETGDIIYESTSLRGFRFPHFPLGFDRQSSARMVSMRVPRRGSPFRLGTFSFRENTGETYIIQVATYLRTLEKTVDNLRENLSIAFGLAIILSCLSGWALSRQSLKPIGSITESTNKITATNLKDRLPLKGSEDELDRLAATINDMLDRLEESFEKLVSFTADAAHELRTPVAALRGETEVLLSRDRSLEDYRDALANNLERLDFLSKLINDLLLLAQADEGNRVLKIESVSIHDLLRDLVEAFSMVAEQKAITLLYHEHDTRPVQGDPIKLRRLFSNLIDNALKYTPGGGTVVLDLTEDDDHITISVQDTGIGISPNELPYIFDRFYRVDKSRSRESGGTGLGLSICQWIARAHHGTMHVTSQLGLGTTVTAVLPVTLQE
ncbi:MAG TPA: heavy metal sensor histidine kinase [Thermodesulfobacteriota bacterium]|nr:heavy metal sensor histidine kinase [Thermodesulfobacteriota bacterium]HNU72401.1 heavy metal sensor histidine kinase [Thermodesulfobacteriota bacterium]